MASKNGTAAEIYARLGWKVFPILPLNKRPRTTHGFHDATTDAGQIAQWWHDNPTDGIGIATGLASKLIVIDIDPRNGGNESLASLLKQHGELPPGPVCDTGGGGRHYYLAHPGGVFPCTKPWPGIDIKSDGGYVIAPFSSHPSGTLYQWHPGQDPMKIKPPEVPAWLFEALLAKKNALVEEGTVLARGRLEPDAAFGEGQRNDALTSLAGTMQRRGMSFEAILQALLAENGLRCKPPLDEDEVYRIVSSVARYEPTDPIETPQTGTPQGTSKNIRLVDLSVAAMEDPPEVEWILPGMIAKGDCSLFVGPPGSGKSWITMELGVAGAAQRPIFGIFQNRPLKVLVVDEENPADEQHRRLRALVKAWELEGPELLGRLHLTQPCQGFSFRDPEYVRSLYRLVDEFRPDLIVLDSMTAVSTIRNENDAVEVRQFFHDHLYPLRSICGSTILCVHHTSKAAYQYDEQVEEVGMARGSIDYIAASDSAMILRPVQRGGTTLRLAPIKTRRGRIPDPIIMEIVDGTEGGARPLARTPAKASKAPDTKSQRARQILLQFLEDSPGVPVPGEALRDWTQTVDPTLSPADVRYALSSIGADGRLQISKGGEDGRESLYLLLPPRPRPAAE